MQDNARKCTTFDTNNIPKVSNDTKNVIPMSGCIRYQLKIKKYEVPNNEVCVRQKACRHKKQKRSRPD